MIDIIIDIVKNMSTFEIFIATIWIVFILLLIYADYTVRKNPDNLIEAQSYNDPFKPFPISILFFTIYEQANRSKNLPVNPYRTLFIILIAIFFFIFHTYSRK